MKYLVTGGAGFLGSALVKRLASSGHEVVILDDFSRGKADRLAGITCEVVSGDIRDPEIVTHAMHGCESVIHMAYLQGTQTFYTNPMDVLDVALRGILNILDSCRKTGCGELLLISSSEAYQVASEVPTPEGIPLTVPDVLNPRYSYGGGKIACELAALAWARNGILDRMIIARPHNIYGPDMGREHVIPEFCIRMNTQVQKYPDGIIPFRIQGTGQETRSFCYVDDCIDQLTMLLNRGETENIYHIGTMDEKTISDVAHGVADCYDREIKIIPGALPKGSPPRRLPDMEKVRQLGHFYYPEVPFALGLMKTVKWYRENT